MELDIAEEMENNFMNNKHNRDPFLYLYDAYFFDDFNVFENEEEEDNIYFDFFINIPHLPRHSQVCFLIPSLLLFLF